MILLLIFLIFAMIKDNGDERFNFRFHRVLADLFDQI